MAREYIARVFDDILAFALKSKGAVIVEGPKWCGKSTTSARFAKTVIDLMPLNTRDEIIQMAKIVPSILLNSGEKPIMIDEWQHIEFIWDQIKYEVDKSGTFGNYILTGSVSDKTRQQALVDGDRHTGNGRIVRKRMRTMSLFETGDGNGSVSLLAMKNNSFTPSISNATIYDYAFYICRGGWPMAIKQERDISLQQARDYFDVIVSDDIYSLKSVALRPNEERARKVMQSYARNVSIAASDQALREDVSNGDARFDKDVFHKYMLALKRLFVIDELPAWNPNLRSKTAIRTKETRHFCDPSIAAAALNLSPDGLFKDITTFGLLFESLVIHDLRVYCDAIGARLYKYRDGKKREADAVIQFQDGSWALVEVKLGNQEDIDYACQNLQKIANDINQDKMGKPVFLMVVTKNKLAYRNDDGVYIVPLACLRP